MPTYQVQMLVTFEVSCWKPGDPLPDIQHVIKVYRECYQDSLLEGKELFEMTDLAARVSLSIDSMEVVQTCDCDAQTRKMENS